MRNDPTVKKPIKKEKLEGESSNENEYSLENLLADITEQNLHPEFETGYAVGKEVW